MAVCLFSLVGLPPFGEFIAKWYLLLASDAKLSG
jgi:NADH:ubiquinone oxidoreductase subunit 2 (subunit N)